MIQMVRIDDRLVHGQVAYSWKAFLKYQAIVIADDDVCNDTFRKPVIKMAAPQGVKVAIKSISDAVILLQNPKLADIKVFVVVSSAKSAYELYKLLETKPVLNLGGSMHKEGAKEFSKAVYLTPEEVNFLDLLYKENVDIDVRQTPAEQAQDYKTLRSKF